MHTSTHLMFAGRCAEAFKFYERAFGGKLVTLLAYGDTPMAADVPPERHGWIVHATLTLGGHELLGADVPSDEYSVPRGFYVLLAADDAAHAERIFAALSDG